MHFSKNNVNFNQMTIELILRSLYFKNFFEKRVKISLCVIDEYNNSYFLKKKFRENKMISV